MPRLVGLQCPQCRKNVEGENHSLVFFCRACQLAFDVAEKIARFPLHFVKPQIRRDGPRVYFPFWRIEAQYRILTGTPGSTAPVKNHFLIPAYFNKHVGTITDIGTMYFQKRVTLRGDTNQDWPIHPAIRPARSAMNHPALYLMKMESERTGGKKAEIEMGEQQLMMVLVPFFHTGGQYIDSQGGIAFPQGALL